MHSEHFLRSPWLWLAVLFVGGVMLFERRTAPQRPGRRAVATQRGETERSIISGVVTDGRRPIAGATVRVPGRVQFVRSDPQGAFALPLPMETRGEFSLAASKTGYFIGGLRLPAAPKPGDHVGEIVLKPLPAEDCAAYRWVDPRPDAAAKQNCGNCHREIYDEWRLDAHSRAAQNRRLLNLYDGSDWHGQPGKGWSLQEEHPHGAGVCSSCHAPGVEPGDPAFDDLRRVSGAAAQGVHCDLCHKIQNVADEHAGLTHGRFGLEWLRPAAGQLFFGPLDDVDRGEDAFSALQTQSRFCAACHEGTVFGAPVYTTYSEWLSSPARREGKQCQTCHMKPTGSLTNIAPGAGGIERDPRTLATHQFLPGGREAMLKRSLQLAITPAPWRDGVAVNLKLAAHDVGHCLPTGFIDRHLVLAVQAFDAEDRSLDATAGPRLPAAAGPALADEAGLLFARLLSDEAGRGPVPFWRAGARATDTRLRPDEAIEATWRFPPAARQLRVRLWHRRFWPEVAAAKSWPDDSLLVFDRRLQLEPTRANLPASD